MLYNLRFEAQAPCTQILAATYCVLSHTTVSIQ
jgi:hypothetical protein